MIGSLKAQCKGERKRKRGQATVELALIVTLLVLLLVGVADVARIYGEQLAVVHAAGIGARWAALPEDQRDRSYTNVCDVVRFDLREDLPSGLTLTVQTARQTNNRIKVTVTYPHDFLFGLFKPGGMFITLPSSYTTRATMPVLQGVDPASDATETCAIP